MEAVVDGKKMLRRQLVTPLDHLFLVTTGFEQGADDIWSVTPQPGRGKIPVHFYTDLTHGDAEAPVLLRQPLKKRQWIDKGLELEGVDGAGGSGSVRDLVNAATEPGSRNGDQGGERRLPE